MLPEIKVDKNRSAEDYIKLIETHFIVPEMIKSKFPDLVKLIYETESMNGEEREYWLQIMPIMEEEQTSKFRQILVKERDELAKLDNEYNKEMARINQKLSGTLTEEEMKKKFEHIKQMEAQIEEREKIKEAEILEQLNNL